ncbi:DUF4359 domain-containing protein [Nitrospira sp. Nam80]
MVVTSWHLGIIVAVLLVAIGLAVTNPTTEEYLHFIELKLAAALDRMDQPEAEKAMIRAVFQSQKKQLVDGIVRSSTQRENWGLWSMYRTKILDQEVVVVGVATWFVPLHGVEEATLKIGRLAF